MKSLGEWNLAELYIGPSFRLICNGDQPALLPQWIQVFEVRMVHGLSAYSNQHVAKLILKKWMQAALLAQIFATTAAACRPRTEGVVSTPLEKQGDIKSENEGLRGSPERGECRECGTATSSSCHQSAEFDVFDEDEDEDHQFALALSEDQVDRELSRRLNDLNSTPVS